MIICNGAPSSWCNIGVSLGVGGFFGSWGAIVIASSIYFANTPDSDFVIGNAVTGFFWMAGWSAGVVVWGGQDGALYAGLWWGAIILVGWLCRYPSMFATFRSRVAQIREKPDLSLPI